MPRPPRTLLLLTLSLGLGCESADVELRCANEDCTTVPPASPEPVPTMPPPLPVPPEIVKSYCEHPNSITWQPSDLANEASFERPCLTERLDEDGCVGERIEHQFDAQGLVVRTERWVFDPDVLTPAFVPPTSAITTYAYDPQGRRTERTHDDLSDGTVDLTDAWTYDALDRIVVETRAHARGTRRVERTYDAEDRVVLEETFDSGTHHRRRREWHPSGALRSEYVFTDGVLVWSRDHDFDEAGRPTREHQVWPAEGKTETTLYVYGALGLSTRTWTRRLGTGTTIEEHHQFSRWPNGATRSELFEQTVNGERISRRRRSEFDSAGRELSKRNDRNADGTFESGRSYTYDASGHRLTERTYDGDRVLRDVRRRFDGEGREVERVDAVRGLIVSTAYEGRQVRVSTTDLDGAPINETITVYDREEHVLSIEADKDGDGRIDERYENAWSEAGLLVGSRGDRDGDGVWDYASALMYDRAGQLLYSMSDADNDAQPERSELHSYACLLLTP